MHKKKIAVFSVSAGAGHVRAAEALKATAEQYQPEVEIVHIDVMTLVGRLFRQLYADSYLSIVERHPQIWGYLYQASDRARADQIPAKLRRAIERVNTSKFRETLDQINPDHIICTHFLPAELLSRMLRHHRLHCPTWVQVTDFDIHSLWIVPAMTGYFAASDEVAARMQDRGLREEAIHVTGIPIMPSFSQKLAREICAVELGLDPRRPILLMMSGGAGMGGIDRLTHRLLQIPGDFQIMALAGKNPDLLRNLQTLAAQFPGRLFPMGFTRTVERCMAAADFAVTKPGGLTTSECLAMGLPVVVISPIPGQEERNADYLLESGAALKAYDAAGLAYRVRCLLAAPAKLQEMRQKAAALGRPRAAQQILSIVLGDRPSPQPYWPQDTP